MLLPTDPPNPSHHMCKTKRSTAAFDPKPKTQPSSARSSGNLTSRATSTPTGTSFPNTNDNTGSGGGGGGYRKRSSGSSSSSSGALSLSSLKASLPERPAVYSIADIRSATKNFLAPRHSTSSWRCNLHGKDVLIFQRELNGDPARLPESISSVCRSHHNSLVRLLGAAVRGTDCVYLVYDFVKGASLSDCLRNRKNPNFTPLSSWLSRMQVAADVAQGLVYIHHLSGSAGTPSLNPRRRLPPVHNRIKSSGILVTDPELRGKICHVGTAELTGEMDENVEMETPRSGKIRRAKKIEGSRGYMAPEIADGAPPSQKSDVYAFGVVLLELMSGEEPVRFRYDMAGVDRESLIDTARDVIGAEDELEEEERHGRTRRWVDRRLKDSFPVDVAEKVLQLALECVEADEGKRPDMKSVAAKLSTFLEKSEEWAANVKRHPDITVSLGPR